MPSSMSSSAVSRHPELPEKTSGQAKADTRAVPKAEICEEIERLREIWRGQVGSAIIRARALSGLSLKEFAAAVNRDPRQIARWEAGIERPQFDALFAAPQLRRPLVIALSELAGDGVEVSTTITVRSASR